MASKYFFWIKWIDIIILGSFWWVIFMAFVLWVPFLRPWWWIFLPLFLSMELRKLYFWWLRWDYAYAKKKWVVLEIVPPKEILVPIKAMEDVFTVMWAAFFDQPNWREQWCEGSLPETPSWISWEIVSLEGKLHFYIKLPEASKAGVETSLYNHFPSLEITEVPDYTKLVPRDVPNQEWDAYGEDYILVKPTPYPIKTYEKFFEPQGERISAEEKRIDPLGSLLESMTQLGSGEHFWLQLITMPVSDKEEPDFKSEGEKIIAKITKRPEKKPKQSFGGAFLKEFFDAIHFLIVGSVAPGSDAAKKLDAGKSESGEREMVITPGEREIVSEIENKLRKPIFRTKMTGIYIAKREKWNASHKKIAGLYFSHFQTGHLNFIKYSSATRPKTHYVLRKRIPFVRARRMFRNFVLRFTPLFPNRKSEMALLCTEELATLFHFPLKIGGLSFSEMTRVESKKTGPPPNLPME